MPEVRATVEGVVRVIDHMLIATGREQHRRQSQPPPSASRLLKTIESEVIPRLLLIHGVGATEPRAASGVTASDVESLVTHLLSRSDDFVSAYVSEIDARGIDLETLLLDLLAPSARLLGVMWEEDLCDFTDVTVALTRLQRLLRVLSARLDGESEEFPNGLAILLSVTPGEQHTFGLTMVGEFFRRAGWSVSDDLFDTERDIVECVRRRPYAVIGLSLSGEVLLDRLVSVIKNVRGASLNRKIGVIVGGAFFQEHPELVPVVGADASALDGREAVIQSTSLARLLADGGR